MLEVLAMFEVLTVERMLIEARLTCLEVRLACLRIAQNCEQYI